MAGRPRAIALDGTVAIEHIMMRAAPALAKLWDGTKERIGFVLQQGDSGNAAVGFWERPRAAEALRARAAEASGEQAMLLGQMAAAALSPPPDDGVQCVLHGWEACVLVVIHPDDLATAARNPRTPSDQEIAGIYIACETQSGAIDALGQVLNGFAASGAPAPAELSELVRALEEHWDDPSTIAVAAARARAACAAHLPDPPAQRACLVLNMLVEANGKRVVPGANAPGGSA